MQISERLLVVEPAAFRHKTFDELQHTAGTIDKPAENLARISVGGVVATLVKQPFRLRGPFDRRQIEKCQEIARLVVSTRLLELSAPLCIDQRGSWIRKRIGRIGSCRMTLRLDKDRPAGFQAPQCVVETARNGNEFGRHGAVKVRSPKFRRPLERPILVQDDPLIDKSRPWQKIGKSGIGPAIFGEIHHGRPHGLRWPGMRRCRRTTSTKSGSRLVAQTAAMWPTNQRRRPASQRRKPIPSAAASVPLRIAIERGAPPIRIGSVSARWTGASKPAICPSIRSPLPRRMRRTTERSLRPRRRSTDRTRSESACGNHPRYRRTRAIAR